MNFILDIPYYFNQGLVGLWWVLGDYIPHYSWAEYGSLLKGFLWLIPARVLYGILFPEKVVVKNGRRLFRKRGVKPSKTDHQTASAAIYEILKH